MRALRPDQSDAMQMLRQAMMGGLRHVVMQAPTGFGKTVLSAEVVNSARRKNKKVLFTVPAISLVDQTVEMFYQQGISDVGVIQANHRQTDGCQPVQVASVQTLQKREMPEADVVLIDEVHKWFDFYGKTMREAWLDKPVIGLSATPWRKGLGNFFGRLLIASTTSELIDKGLLSDFKVFSPTHPDLEGIRTVAGDYHEGELAERMSNVRLIADIIATWMENGRGRPTLCFAVDCAHGKHLKDQFEAAGVRVAYQDAHTKDQDRAAIKKGFHDGSIEVVVNIGTLTTGIDWDVRCIILARPTKSEMLFVQIMGRGLRTANGKDHLLCLDHSDNHLRLGFVTDIDANHGELLNGSDATDTVTDRIRLPKECPSCSFLKPPGTARCPVCQFVAVKHNKIEPTAGELKELARQQKAEKENIDRGAFLAELKAYCERKGFKPGWASNKYREKFGVWPHNGIAQVAPQAGVSAAAIGWIKRGNIAWAKSQGRRFA
jgi:superfamily II DNA or RNA helicase